MKVLLLGGTRFLGPRLVRPLVAAGDEVFVAHRGVTGDAPEGSVSLHLDRSTGEGLTELAALRPDAVVDLSGYQARWVEKALATFAGLDVHYVFISSGAVYRPSPELPWPETQPLGPSPLWGEYATQKLEAERLLGLAQADGTARTSILRFPFVMGPDNYADRESFVLSRILAGRPIFLSGGGVALNQHLHVEDATAAIERVLSRPDRSAGYAFNCGLPRGITNRGFVELCAQELGEEANLIAIDEQELGIAQSVFDLTDLVFPFPAEHYLLDCSLLRERLGFEPRRGNREILRDFIAGWDHDRPPRSYPREDRALAALATGDGSERQQGNG